MKNAANVGSPSAIRDAILRSVAHENTADAGRALAFLMDWPALPAAAGLIEARADELRVHADQAELWAARLRARQPRAACRLLRAAAALAFKRREFATCERLTQEADAITVD